MEFSFQLKGVTKAEFEKRAKEAPGSPGCSKYELWPASEDSEGVTCLLVADALWKAPLNGRPPEAYEIAAAMIRSGCFEADFPGKFLKVTVLDDKVTLLENAQQLYEFAFSHWGSNYPKLYKNGFPREILELMEKKDVVFPISFHFDYDHGGVHIGDPASIIRDLRDSLEDLKPYFKVRPKAAKDALDSFINDLNDDEEMP